jgi:hypothetical protein
MVLPLTPDRPSALRDLPCPQTGPRRSRSARAIASRPPRARPSTTRWSDRPRSELTPWATGADEGSISSSSPSRARSWTIADASRKSCVPFRTRAARASSPLWSGGAERDARLPVRGSCRARRLLDEVIRGRRSSPAAGDRVGDRASGSARRSGRSQIEGAVGGQHVCGLRVHIQKGRAATRYERISRMTR